MYRKLFFPLLARLDAERAHGQTLFWLSWAQRPGPGRLFLRLIAGRLPAEPVEVFGLSFPNVLGLAAGFDKDALVISGAARLGFGHVEVGTLTPRPQPGNPKPRIFRLPSDGALINRMGFPNAGVEAAVPRLISQARPNRRFRLGVSLGKQGDTPLEDAVGDYIHVMRAVYTYTDYLAVNVSSPNTPGLRRLQGSRYLQRLLFALQHENQSLATDHGVTRRPLLLKISPDLDRSELAKIVETALDNEIDGIIATNTTVSRHGVTHEAREQAGGLSGLPLRERSTEIIAAITRLSQGKLPVIGVGGVRTADDVRAKLDAGASLVQIYTGLIYEGPGMVGRILRELYGEQKAGKRAPRLRPTKSVVYNPPLMEQTDDETV